MLTLLCEIVVALPMLRKPRGQWCFLLTDLLELMNGFVCTSKNIHFALGKCTFILCTDFSVMSAVRWDLLYTTDFYPRSPFSFISGNVVFHRGNL